MAWYPWYSAGRRWLAQNTKRGIPWYSLVFGPAMRVFCLFSKNNNALYFSREPIPSNKKYSDSITKYKQVCIIPFLRNSLIKFNDIPQTTLEIIESIDMLRLIENGSKVKMVEIEDQVYSVDTLEDLKKVEKLMKNDTLVNLYDK